MPKYTSRDGVKSGVPLGGIGAGKIEIMPNGTINFITFQNNWSQPIDGGLTGVLGFHFGLSIESGGKRVSRLLHTAKMSNFPHVDKVDYEGSFPFATLNYFDKKIPLDVELLAYSSFIPGNSKDSSLPGANFKFKLKNPTKTRQRVSLLVMGRNLIGNWGVGRFNAISKDRDQVHLTFNNGRKESLRNDFTLGDMTISVPIDSGDVSYLGEWNMQGECFVFLEKDVRFDAWDHFARVGRLPNVSTKKVVDGESQELGGALAVTIDLEPGETKEIPVIYSWFFPVHTVGHVYSKWFKNSVEVSNYMYKEDPRLYNRTRKWHDTLIESSLPRWFSDALVNNLYPLVSSTWHGRDGSFATYEAPMVCPLMGTLDVRFYGSLPVSLFFPDLELDIMKRFASARRSDGYIPHDLGRNRIDLPSDGTTYYKWKDLCSKFVLLCYRDYIFTKDKKFLKKVYPSVKKAIEWQFSQDKNRDFLPDNEGQDQTFDLWNFYGANSYTAGIFLAALLAAIKMADLRGDARHQKLYKEWFKNGRKSFDEKLWNGKYFVNYICNKKGSETSCTIGQLNGQWYAHMLGLGYITSRDKVRKAIKSIIKLNGGKSHYGFVNSVFSDGRINKSSNHSKHIFLGMSYAFASLCIYEGFEKEGMKLAKRIWDNMAFNLKTSWNQPDMVDYRNGKGLFGDYYMRNMAIWSMLPALAKHDKKINKTFKAIIKR